MVAKAVLLGSWDVCQPFCHAERRFYPAKAGNPLPKFLSRRPEDPLLICCLSLAYRNKTGSGKYRPVGLLHLSPPGFSLSNENSATVGFLVAPVYSVSAHD